MSVEINKEQITVVKQFNKEHEKSLIYSPAKTESHWFGLVKESFKEGYWSYLEFAPKIKPFEFYKKRFENIYEENNKVYWKPCLKIEMSSGQTLCKYFPSLIELQNWREENLSGIQLIII